MHLDKRKFKEAEKPFKYFSGEIILCSIRCYFQYALSYIDLQEMAAERSLSIERSTLCRWVHNMHQYFPTE